jgi:trans-aconitate 2-methyltransferase
MNTQQLMQWNPEDYASHSDAQLKWARELRQNFHLQGHEWVLDVGCGDGKITADFAMTVPQGRVVGIDRSPEMIAYATRTYPSQQYPNLSFACMDARSLHVEQAFDLCFSNAVLHWVDDHAAFVQGADRALRCGGRLVISCGGRGNAADILSVLSELTACDPWRRYFDGFRNPYFFYGEDDYAQWLGETNFEVERLERVAKDMTHAGQEGLAGWIRTTWMPFTQAVPEAQRDDFIAHFVEAYLDRFPLDPNGLAHVRMVRLEVQALKR